MTMKFCTFTFHILDPDECVIYTYILPFIFLILMTVQFCIFILHILVICNLPFTLLFSMTVNCNFTFHIIDLNDCNFYLSLSHS